jgi:hypothetical protein
MLRLVRCQVLSAVSAVSVLGAPLLLVKGSPSANMLDLGSALRPLVPSSCGRGGAESGQERREVRG